MTESKSPDVNVGQAMKAITIWQPWASLIMLGKKTIETRSWATSYRGPLAIHAAKRKPEGDVGDYSVDWGCDPTLTTETSGYREDGFGYLLTDQREFYAPLPTGAVVGTCNLVDVVQIGSTFRHGQRSWLNANSHSYVDDCPHEGELPHQLGGLWLIGTNKRTGGAPSRIEHERPYGDYSDGRYAWLLDNIQAFHIPIPAVGKQQLWEWSE